MPDGGDHLHGGDPGTRGDPRGIFDRHGGHPCHFQRAVQTVIPPHHGVSGVNVAAPEQVGLLRAVNDLPVGEIGGLLFPQDLLFRIPVKTQRDIGLFLHLQQFRDQPVVSPFREYDVRIAGLHQPVQ